MKKLVDVLRENKGGHIHYWDNGEWALYGAKDWADYTASYAKFESAEEPMEEPEWPDSICEGSDRDGEAYNGSLVTALAKLAGISVDSI